MKILLKEIMYSKNLDSQTGFYLDRRFAFHGFRYLQWSYASYGYPGEVGKGVKCPHYRPF